MFVRLAALLAVLAGLSPACALSEEARRPARISDSIEMTLMGELFGRLTLRTPAVFSPDGHQFVIVTERGRIAENDRLFSLLWFSIDENLQHAGPRRLVEIASALNTPGISDVNWLDDRRIIFLGMTAAGTRQVHVLEVKGGAPRRLTSHPTDIVSLTASADGKTHAYLARSPTRYLWNDKTRAEGLVIGDQFLGELIEGSDESDNPTGLQNRLQLYAQRDDGPPIRIKVPDDWAIPTAVNFLAIAPDGRTLVVRALSATKVAPESWSAFVDEMTRWRFPIAFFVGSTETGETRFLLDAPAPGNDKEGARWIDSRRVHLARAYVPVRPGDDAPRKKIDAVRLEVDTATGEFKQLESAQSDGLAPRAVEVVEVQDMNTPPHLVASNRDTGKKLTIFDPNEQLQAIELGRVEELTWKATDDGHETTGGLFLPPGHVPGQRHPLVIQTHGWNARKFLIDGMSGSAGYAARALAAVGFVVVQVPDDKWLGNTKEAPRAVAGYEGLIDELDRRGLIDRDRVGLQAWSRTGLHVRHALVFSKYRFGAAVMVDCLDGSYGQHMVWRHRGRDWGAYYEDFMGGSPYGDGMKQWLANATGFHLHKVRAPVRLVALRQGFGIMNDWEWFSGLRYFAAPVEMVWMPLAAHSPVRPRERLVTQQGTVDWFRFWLQGYEDPDPDKEEQYARWRKLRELKR